MNELVFIYFETVSLKLWVDHVMSAVWFSQLYAIMIKISLMTLCFGPKGERQRLPGWVLGYCRIWRSKTKSWWVLWKAVSELYGNFEVLNLIIMWICLIIYINLFVLINWMIFFKKNPNQSNLIIIIIIIIEISWSLLRKSLNLFYKEIVKIQEK